MAYKLRFVVSSIFLRSNRMASQKQLDYIYANGLDPGLFVSKARCSRIINGHKDRLFEKRLTDRTYSGKQGIKMSTRDLKLLDDELKRLQDLRAKVEKGKEIEW